MRKKTFYIQTFGCQMNVHDSEQMSVLLEGAGYRPTDQPELADIIIVNTCSIRSKAEQKVNSQIGRFRRLKSERPGLVIGVAGCLAQQRSRVLTERNPFLDLVIGTHNIHLLPRMLERRLGKGAPVVETAFRDHVESIGIFSPPPKGAVSAFVTVMQGCDNYCAYCVVPYLRGREESRDPESVLNEIRKLADYGVKEVTLLGQNVNSYGKSSGNGFGFAKLLQEAGRIRGIERIRFTTSHPRDLTDDIIRCFAEVDALCDHIHLPVQSGSDAILKAMNRGYTSSDYLKKVDKLREMCSNISITSDFIVGFPGEAEDDFRQTLRLMESVRFDGSFSFNYSDREGTAALRFEGKIDEEIKGQRLTILQKLQDRHTLERNKALEGRLQEVLVEGHSKNSVRDLTGRTRCNRIVNFEADPGLIGKTVQIGIEKAYLHSLRGKLQV